MVGVPGNILQCLRGRVDAHLGWSGERTCAIDDARLEDMRTQLGPGVESGDAGREVIEVVRHVARARHSVCKVERAVVVGKVLMVVPEARHQELAAGIDDLGAILCLDCRVGADANHVPGPYQHARTRQ